MLLKETKRNFHVAAGNSELSDNMASYITDQEVLIKIAGSPGGGIVVIFSSCCTMEALSSTLLNSLKAQQVCDKRTKGSKRNAYVRQEAIRCHIKGVRRLLQQTGEFKQQ
jgi:hypothetical protein